MTRERCGPLDEVATRPAVVEIVDVNLGVTAGTIVNVIIDMITGMLGIDVFVGVLGSAVGSIIGAIGLLARAVGCGGGAGRGAIAGLLVGIARRLPRGAVDPVRLFDQPARGRILARFRRDGLAPAVFHKFGHTVEDRSRQAEPGCCLRIGEAERRRGLEQVSEVNGLGHGGRNLLHLRMRLFLSLAISLSATASRSRKLAMIVSSHCSS